MNNKKSTKRALTSSILSLVLCMAMLIGSTFAWFTDSVTSGNNIIKSGTLDVAMEWANGKEDPATATWTDASTGPIFNNDLWEPGYTEARHIKITNKGTLAMNWTLAIVANGEVSSLADVIDVYYFDRSTYGGMKQINDRDVSGLEYRGTLSELLGTGIFDSDKAYSNQGGLKAGESFSMTIVLKMREEAGNEYQNLSIGTDFAVQLLATQRAFEEDSFGKDYDEFAGKTVVTPANAQEAIWAAQEGDIIYLQSGVYDTLVIENEDGTSKKGITIEHNKPGTNPTSDPFSVGHINLNSSEDITIRGIYFETTEAQIVYGKSGATEYVASITGAKDGAAKGAKNIVIDNCKFNSFSAAAEKYVPICFEEQGRPTSRATNITVMNCISEDATFNFVRMNYMAKGTITIQNNSIAGGTTHNALNFTGNAADLLIRDNSFGFAIGSRAINNGWNIEKAMLGTSRQGDNHINVEVTGNTFINETLGNEGHVIELKSSYKADNCTLVFEDNTFKGDLASMTEDTVPCIWH